MTTPAPAIHDITDLLRILRDNPEWLDQVRNVVLTQEILELPATLAALTQELRDFIAEQRAINQEQKRTNDAIFARLDRIEADVAETKTDVKELKTTVSGLVTTTNRLDGAVSKLLGADAEHYVHSNIDHILRREDPELRRIYILRSISQTIDPDLSDQIDDAADNGIVTQDEQQALRVVDLITRAQIKGSTDPIYHAIEVSVVVDENDVQRAIDQADILSRATSAKTVPAVIGGIIIPTAIALAQTHGILAITNARLTPAQNQSNPTNQ